MYTLSSRYHPAMLGVSGACRSSFGTYEPCWNRCLHQIWSLQIGVLLDRCWCFHRCWNPRLSISWRNVRFFTARTADSHSKTAKAYGARSDPCCHQRDVLSESISIHGSSQALHPWNPEATMESDFVPLVHEISRRGTLVDEGLHSKHRWP